MSGKINYILKNQRLEPETQVKISINDRSFLFGDGIFESCKINNFCIYNFDNHLKRLKFGLKSLKIDLDLTNLEQNCQKLITKNNIKNGILKINISRGSASLGYKPLKSKALLIARTDKSRPKPQNVTLGISPYHTPNIYLGKTSNCLPYILTKIAANEAGFFDNIMLDNAQNIAETSSANIFWKINNELFTPPPTTNLIIGTMRQKVLELSPITITQKLAKLEDLQNCDEIFLTNAAYGVLGIKEFNNKKLSQDFSQKLQKIIELDIKNTCKN